MSRRVNGARVLARAALLCVVFASVIPFMGVTAASAQSSSVTHYCFKDNGRFDITLTNPNGSIARVFEVELTGLPVRVRTVASGQTKSLSFTGREDGKYRVEVRTGGRTIEVYDATVACDPEVAVKVDCLSGNGRIAVGVVNRTTGSAVYRVSVTGLPPRARIVGEHESGRFMVTGRADKPYDVLVVRNGLEIYNDTVTVDCDPDGPVLQADETVMVVSCALGKGRFDIQVFFAPDSALPAAMFFEITTGQIRPRTAVLTQGSTFKEFVTGRNNGEHTVTVRANGAIYFRETVTVDC